MEAVLFSAKTTAERVGSLERMARRFFLLPLAVGGICLSIVMSKRSRGWIIAAPDPRGPRKLPDVRAKLRAQLLGQDKSMIVQTLGAPPTTGEVDPERPADWRGEHFRSSIWYYPLDAHTHHAIAIEFDGELARSVQFISAPDRN